MIEARKRSALGFWIGDRVRIHPTNDLFRTGVKYADVAKIGRKFVHVKDDGGRVFKLRPSSIEGKA